MWRISPERYKWCIISLDWLRYHCSRWNYIWAWWPSTSILVPDIWNVLFHIFEVERVFLVLMALFDCALSHCLLAFCSLMNSSCFHMMRCGYACVDAASTEAAYFECPLEVIHRYVDGLVQERRNSSALAMELRLSCAKPSIWWKAVLESCKCAKWFQTILSWKCPNELTDKIAPIPGNQSLWQISRQYSAALLW